MSDPGKAQRPARLAAEYRVPLELEDLRQLLEEATVHVVCAPEDAPAVQRWVDALEDAHLVRLRTSVFVAPGRALCWQLDGILAPRRPQLVAVPLLGR